MEPQPCKVCLHYRGESIFHSAEGCNAAKNVKCRRCHNRGHFTSDCKEGYAQWERPTCYEELIPADVRIRFGIRVGTLPEFVIEKPRGADTLHELANETNTIELPPLDDKEFYKKTDEVITLYNIPVKTKTKESKESRLKAIQEWCVAHGRHLTHVLRVAPAAAD